MKVKSNRCIFIVVLLLCLGISAEVMAADPVININDILELSVFDHPEMAATVRVDGQGMVTLPLINRVKVQGLTVSEASSQIARMLADGYIVNPQVNIFVKNFRDQKASILGMVTKPGVYDISAKTTLLELISMAGGLSPEAGDTATIKREGTKDTSGNSQEMTIDLRRLVDKGDSALNIQIMEGDKIFVIKAGLFFVTGEVKKPDSYKYQDKLTVMKAIAMAGGFTDTASKGSVRIVRKVNGKEEVVSGVDMDALVRPDDVVVVPESFF